MKNINEIAQAFAQLHKPKSLYLHQVKPLLDAYYQLENKGNLSQKISFISALASFVQTALRNQLTMVERLKYEVFYSFIDSSSKKEKRGHIKTRKTYKKVQKGPLVEMTLDQILEDAVARGLNQMNQTITVLPSKVNEPENPNNAQTIVASFQPEIIAELSQHLKAHNISQKEPEPVQWLPNKLENYQKWLALTQNVITASKSEKVPRTKKRNPPAQKQVIKDDKIDITQGDDPAVLLEKLQTKIKMGRRSPQIKIASFKSIMEQLQSSWMKNEYFRQKLTAILGFQKIKNLRSQEKHSQHENMLVSDYFNPRNSLNASKEKYSNDSKTKIDDLGNKLTKFIGQAILKDEKIKFSAVCKSHSLNIESKGDIFHSLLHLDFDLQQRNVEFFGEIYISPKAW